MNQNTAPKSIIHKLLLNIKNTVPKESFSTVSISFNKSYKSFC